MPISFLLSVHYAEKLPPGFFGEHSGFFDGIWSYIYKMTVWDDFLKNLYRAFWEKNILRWRRGAKAGTQNGIKYASKPKNKGTLFSQRFHEI